MAHRRAAKPNTNTPTTRPQTGSIAQPTRIGKTVPGYQHIRQHLERAPNQIDKQQTQDIVSKIY
eukprot:961875-Alexandrium_andersonii.AAC.1